jgi:hypothetical protein
MSSLSTSVIASFASFASCLLALNAGTPFSDEQRTLLESFVQTPTTTTILVEKAKKPRKATAVKDAKKVAEEAALLAPAESAATAEATATAPAEATATAEAVVEVAAPPVKTGAGGALANTFDDPLRHHKYRIATYDTTLCVARKTDEKNPIVGTRPGDEGSKKMFYPEKQCSKKPLAGGALCKLCSEKDVASKANQEVKAWYGRLDEPLHPQAYVVGSECFYTKYPQGLLNDPTTRPPIAAGGAVVAVAAVAASETKATKVTKVTKVTKAKKAPAKGTVVTVVTVAAKEAASAEAVVETADSAVESVAVETAPEIIRHVIFLHKGKSYVRDAKNGNVYTHKVMTTAAETVRSENYAGRWMDGEIKPYEDEVVE